MQNNPKHYRLNTFRTLEYLEHDLAFPESFLHSLCSQSATLMSDLSARADSGPLNLSALPGC